MLKKIILSSIFLFLTFCFSEANCQELNLVRGKVYLLNFSVEIQNLNADEKNLDAQILHTIFEDKRQIIISLKNSDNSFLQVQTEKDLFNYKIKSATKSSNELVEIDLPPIENFNVDIYTGEV